jgi:hypothetical protein
MQRVTTVADHMDMFDEDYPGLSEELEWFFRDYPPDVSFPATFTGSDGMNGPPVDDPLMMDFALPALSANLDTGPVWRASLEELLEEEFAALANPDTGLIENGDKPIAEAMVRRLRDLADRLSERIAP